MTCICKLIKVNNSPLKMSDNKLLSLRKILADTKSALVQICVTGMCDSGKNLSNFISKQSLKLLEMVEFHNPPTAFERLKNFFYRYICFQ